jgi:hypothetical protein
MMNYTFDIANGLLITNDSDEDSTVYFATAVLSLIVFLALWSWTQRLLLTSLVGSQSTSMAFFQAGSR